MKTIMKTSMLLSAALLATSAAAGVRIETVTRDIKTLAPSGTASTTLVQDGAVRADGGHDGVMILKAGKMLMIDDKRKTYTEMDKATMQAVAEKAKAAMSKMQEQMKQMPPEQRAMMEKMMKQNMPGAADKPVVFDAKDTGKSDTVEGRKCRVWNMTRDGELIDEMCVVPFSTLAGKEDMQKTFTELAEAFEGLASAAPNGAAEIRMRNSVDGYPVRSRPYSNGKPVGTETVLKKWSEESIPKSMFEVPSGYKKRELPQMGGM